METMRLRAFQQPSQVESLLESFAASQRLVPGDAYPICEPASLPPPLRSLLERIQDEQLAWRAWTDDRHVWLLCGEVSLPLSRERRLPVLHLRCYDEDAHLEDTGDWLQGRGGQWQRCGA